MEDHPERRTSYKDRQTNLSLGQSTYTINKRSKDRSTSNTKYTKENAKEIIPSMHQIETW